MSDIWNLHFDLGRRPERTIGAPRSIMGVRELRTTMIQFVTGIANFAVDSTIFTSLSGKNPERKIRQEGLKSASRSPSLNQKKPEELKLLMEHNTRMKQHHCTSANTVDGSEPLKKPSLEDVKGSVDVMENKKRVFIRSRL